MARKVNAMKAVGMTVYIPKRRPHSYVAEWHDPSTGDKYQRTVGTLIKRDAFEAAADLARKALARVSIDRLTWAKAEADYKRLHVDKTSEKNQESWKTTKNHIEKYGAPKFVDDFTGLWAIEWQTWLASSEGPSLGTNSVACYSRYLRAFLRWWRNKDLLERVPYIEVAVEEVPRGKAVKPHQFKKILEKVPEIRPRDSERWDRFLRALARCNLRINELRRLSWDQDAPIRLDTSEEFPLVRFAPKSHKSRKRRIQVVLPEFWKICLETPVPERSGYVFKLPGRAGQMSNKRVVQVISDIGEAAGIVTNHDTGKTATSHDIGRRAFVPQIDGILTQPEAHKAMGHASWQTTENYYDTRDALEVSAKLWAGVDPDP